MQKYRFTPIIIMVYFMFSTGYSQPVGNSSSTRNQVLPWADVEQKKISSGMKVRFTLHHNFIAEQSENHELDQQNPMYSCFVYVPSGENLQVKVRQQATHPLPLNMLKNARFISMANKSIAPKPLIHVQGYHWFRGKRLAQLEINPFLENAQGIQFVDTMEVDLIYSTSSISRNYALNSQEDKQFSSILDKLLLQTGELGIESIEQLQWADTTRLWLPENNQAIKLTIANDGIYRISKVDLVLLDPLLNSIDPTTLMLFNKGIEQPIYVKLGSMNELEYIEFTGLRNYNGDIYRHVPVGKEQYYEYLNRYTDTSYYWLTWGSDQGKRYTVNDSTGIALDTARWYTEKLHIEQNNNYGYLGSDQIEQQNPFWTSGDIWLWGWIFANGEFDIPFTLSQIYTSVPSARIFVKVGNSAANLGITPVSMLKTGVNSYYANDTTLLNQFEQKIIQKSIPTTACIPGLNTLRIQSLPTSSSTNAVVVDWADIEYPRTLTAASDSLWFGFSDLPGTNIRRIIVEGLTTADCILYKVEKYPKKIVGCTITGSGPFSLSFVDTLGNGDRYVLLASTKVQTPSMKLKSTFTNLRDTTRHADYLLITDLGLSGFSTTANSYATFIHQTYNLSTAVIDVKDIFDEFGYGYPVPESIREFLKATTHWTAPMPSFVFLVGRANYDYKNYIKTAGLDIMPNIVPVYGMPVSDPWFATLDDSLIIPQMYIGRLPALTVEEFQRYVQHVQMYAIAPNDDWNKRYMFFAGGSDASETNIFHNVHKQVIQSSIYPAPVGGIARDFYKTTNPQSDYGPYSQEQFQNAIDSGAVLISYIGHSGTQTWDNNIAEVSKLRNTRNRFSLMADFGCSTAKSAEPNIRAFGELFTVDPDGFAVGYIGNSSLGFIAIATTLPQIFYKIILQDTVHTIGMAHLLAKIETNSTYGWQQSPMGRQLLLTNTLIGDPAIALTIPSKPNLAVKSSDISSSPSFPSDDNDSLQLKIHYYNFGSVTQDSVQVQIGHSYLTNDNDTTILRNLPSFQDSLNISYPIRNLPGTHTYSVQLNPLHTIEELNYSDNATEYTSVVQSVSLRVVYPIPGYRSPAEKFVLMNPIKQINNIDNTVTLEIDTTVAFSTPQSYQQPMGHVVTRFNVPVLPQKQYYWRAHFNSLPSVSGSFISSRDSLFRWTQSYPQEWEKNTYVNTVFDSSGVHLSPRIYDIQLISSGYLTGRFGAVEVNGSNILGSTFNRGITVAQLDTMDFHTLQAKTFDTYISTANSDSLASFLNAQLTGSLIAMIVIDEGSNSLTPNARIAIKQYGSQYIDSLGWRAPWALLGQKGNPPGSALEKWLPSDSLQRVAIDTSMTRQNLSGDLLSEPFGPAKQWTHVDFAHTIPPGSHLQSYILGLNSSTVYDTLLAIDTVRSSSLTSIDATKYTTLRLLEKYYANSQGISPSLSEWNVSLLPPPDLAINFQCISIPNDTVPEGDPFQFSADIHNIGEQPAANVQVFFTLLNNGIRQQDTIFIPFIPADSSVAVSYQLGTVGRTGENIEIITIDPQQLIPEVYKINNSYSFPFFVSKDTLAPTFDITIDGQHVYEGDYVLPKPTIVMRIYDTSPLQLIRDSIHIRIDGQDIMQLAEFQQGSGTEKAIITYKSELKGRKEPYTLMAEVRDSSGNKIALPGPLNFIIDSLMNLRNVFNYPNPFSSETYFTFVLTDYASEVEVKIYTVSGRLIQDLQVPPQLNANYKVYWNGRDRDGDELANGVYFYKVIAKNNNGTREAIQKLVKLR